MKREDKAPALPWSVIGVVITGVGAAAWLSLGEDWPMWQAYGVVALGLGGLCLGLSLLLLLMAPRREWPALTALVWETVADDWRAVREVVRQMFGGK